ncbi:beta-ketoacyl-[acyl-carrier-protein] synthase family protein [Arenimonas terrae]|uniref:Beta-ketoacyl-[acyl-carrier-protein] synthase family protein n=1 Tax=Arenimonas terrae TaxID=2546226 RepID=A0A5C4RTL1_9GAMM|nr:beta-ketoacyl-[acyl-carrier-protein] synthase family protein [Arenimonas terrae]TNJ34663.1 beta-ketoacyl-[acyl-carrier-protein] synthase family protein [Arenimonas terrae]
MSPVFLNQLGLTCALGRDVDAVAAALFAADAPRGVALSESVTPGRALALGRVPGELPELAEQPVALRGRNNALVALALAPIRAAVEQAIARYGADRVAVVMGTSTSGVGESEAAHRSFPRDGHWPEGFHYAQQEMGTPARYLAAELGLRGTAHVISTACSSSAKALASGARLLRAGLADAVIAGGADSLCEFTVAGFSALGSVSAQRCNPFSRHRNGINIGEGAALFLMTREPGPVRLAGWGESSDAHHMSAPEPEGHGPERAIREALQRAGLRPADIGYVNLHGTATPQNDAMEAGVMARVFGTGTPCSSTKPLTGHTLGAAGAIEAALCWIALTRHGGRALPPHWWDGAADEALAPVSLVAPGQRADAPLRHVLSQSFAFGGSNAALVLGAG